MALARSNQTMEELRRSLRAAGWSVLLEIDFRRALRERFDARYHPGYFFTVCISTAAPGAGQEDSATSRVPLWSVLLFDTGAGTSAVELIPPPLSRRASGGDLPIAVALREMTTQLRQLIVVPNL